MAVDEDCNVADPRTVRDVVTEEEVGVDSDVVAEEEAVVADDPRTVRDVVEEEVVVVERVVVEDVLVVVVYSGNLHRRIVLSADTENR